MPEEILEGLPVSTEEPATETNEPLENLEASEGTSQPEDLSGQQAIEQNPTEEVWDWTKDERYKKMWKEDTNQLYKSVIHNERRVDQHFKPMEQQYNSFVGKFKDNGLDINELDTHLSKYKELTDPNNPMVQQHSMMQAIYDHPVYSKWMDETVQRIETQEKETRWPGWSQEMIQTAQTQDTRLKELEAKDQAHTEQARITEEVNIATKALGEIKTRAEALNIPYDENKFINSVVNKVHPQYWYNEFMNHNRELLDKMIDEQAQNKVLGKLNKNKQSVPSEGSINSTPSAKGMTSDQQFQRDMKAVFAKS